MRITFSIPFRSSPSVRMTPMIQPPRAVTSPMLLRTFAVLHVGNFRNRPTTSSSGNDATGPTAS